MFPNLDKVSFAASWRALRCSVMRSCWPADELEEDDVASVGG